MFALRFKDTGKLVGFYVSSNDDAEFAVGTETRLSKFEDNVWVVIDRATAERAAENDTPWFNAGFNTPSNKFVGELEVVELTVKGN